MNKFEDIVLYFLELELAIVLGVLLSLFFRTDLRIPAKWQYQKKERNGYHIYYNSKLTGQTPGRWRRANTNE